MGLNIFFEQGASTPVAEKKVEKPLIPAQSEKSYGTLESIYREVRSADVEVAKELEARMEEILVYVNIAENHKNLLDESGRAVVLSRMSYGFRKAGEALAWAIIKKTQAAKNLKFAEGVAAIDEFREWSHEQTKKDPKAKTTADMRRYYTNISPTVLKANDLYASLEGICEYLYTIKMELRDSISSMRSIMYGKSDSNSVGWGAGGSDIG